MLLTAVVMCRYEGTGRSLSLKLLQQLRVEGAKLSNREGARDEQGGASATGRTFREVQLQEPIRWPFHSFSLDTSFASTYVSSH